MLGSGLSFIFIQSFDVKTQCKYHRRESSGRLNSKFASNILCFSHLPVQNLATVPCSLQCTMRRTKLCQKFSILSGQWTVALLWIHILFFSSLSLSHLTGLERQETLTQRTCSLGHLQASVPRTSGCLQTKMSQQNLEKSKVLLIDA